MSNRRNLRPSEIARQDQHLNGLRVSYAPALDEDEPTGRTFRVSYAPALDEDEPTGGGAA
jgi:hypothetical protein